MDSHAAVPVALSIAGSDSGGGAGVQADLRVLQRLGVFGTTAITALTAQNLEGVRAVQGARPDVLAAQIDAVVEGFPVAAVKTGMLWSAALIDVVVDRLRTTAAPLVVDPVMVATSGARLLGDDALASYRALLQRATLVTPNLDEAAVLLGEPVDRARLGDAAARLERLVGCPVLLKGGHLDGPPVDVLAADGSIRAWTHERIEGANTHGSGCMLSAAITAHLAHGHALPEACRRGLAFVHDALARGVTGEHRGLADIESAEVHTRHLTDVEV